MVANPDSSDAETAVHQHDASVDLMTEALERLAESENGYLPERLPEFLPAIDHPSRLLILVELIKMSMAMAMETGQPRWLDDYYAALPDFISPDSSPLDLVMEEIQLRIEMGQAPDHEAYAKRFPKFATMLVPLLSECEATSSTKKLRRPDELSVGSKIDDFEIIRTLGKGVFAHVYLSKQLSMSRLVALKVSRGTGDEPQALAQFDHPNIVRVFDQRLLHEIDIHLLYMQFHPGGTLLDVVRQVGIADRASLSGQLMLNTIDFNLLKSAQIVPDRSDIRGWIANADWPRLVAWTGIQLAIALQEAHDCGIFHRDVKPANVLLTAEGIPQLADFNVSFAGAAGRAGAASTFGGSVGYMSPEHLRAISPSSLAPADSVRERSDLYSLGVLLWELWQGHRPFACASSSDSWTELIEDQLNARERDLLDPQRDGSASERVLESTLRAVLSTDPNDRPSSGIEMAGRLRLAMHPEAAQLFDPAQNSLASRLSRISPWWFATAFILIPNIAAGWFNYQYNNHEIMKPETRAGLHEISIWVNSIAFPLAVVLMIWYTRASVKALRRATEGLPVTSDDLSETLDLGHRAAMIGGGCWMIAGIVYPILLRAKFPDFSTQDASHFFVSLLICGGVAMIYPLFCWSLLATYVYYPRMVRPTMEEPNFDVNARKMVARSESYLLIAAIIPLLGATLMISGESQARGYMLTAIAAGIVGLLGSFFAYRAIVRTWVRLGEVLSTQATAAKSGQRWEASRPS
jgi:serine/threonine protein kinase